MTAPEANPDGQSINFSYLKSNYFRVVHADGAILSVTPRMALQLAFFNERVPIPQEASYQLKEDGGLGDEILSERVTREGIVREVEAEVVLDIATAENLADLLRQKVKETKKKFAESGKPM